MQNKWQASQHWKTINCKSNSATLCQVPFTSSKQRPKKPKNKDKNALNRSWIGFIHFGIYCVSAITGPIRSTIRAKAKANTQSSRMGIEKWKQNTTKGKANHHRSPYCLALGTTNQLARCLLHCNGPLQKWIRSHCARESYLKLEAMKWLILNYVLRTIPGANVAMMMMATITIMMAMNKCNLDETCTNLIAALI